MQEFRSEKGFEGPYNYREYAEEKMVNGHTRIMDIEPFLRAVKLARYGGEESSRSDGIARLVPWNVLIFMSKRWEARVMLERYTLTVVRICQLATELNEATVPIELPVREDDSI
jgi:hypothetical protein